MSRLQVSLESRHLRARYLAFAVVTIAIGLVVHRSDTALPPALRDVAGDALWAIMMTWWVSVVIPRASRSVRALSALAISCVVEFSQLYHAPALDAFRQTTLGHLVLGSDFDVRDLVAYAAGVTIAAAIDSIARKAGRV